MSLRIETTVLKLECKSRWRNWQICTFFKQQIIIWIKIKIPSRHESKWLQITSSSVLWYIKNGALPFSYKSEWVFHIPVYNFYWFLEDPSRGIHLKSLKSKYMSSITIKTPNEIWINLSSILETSCFIIRILRQNEHGMVFSRLCKYSHLIACKMLHVPPLLVQAFLPVLCFSAS